MSVCSGCGNPKAFRTRTVFRKVEGQKKLVKFQRCDSKDCGALGSLKKHKKSPFLCNGQRIADSKELRLNSRQEYAGTDADEHRGRNYKPGDFA